ncbi:MAG TPA: maleylpyruvate isomerase family mycothiol-dependent enzyme [Jiangellales bacterium]|jgi:uncharacterized protein (TIGR03083 family)|nr:maleylpyruvate isomerase family mycothiol-dependent enzyme [Jiangellales bacterium]
MTAIDVATVRRLEADPEEAAAVARTEYERFGALVDKLADHDWSRPTDCTGWEVRHVVAHVLGATEANAHPVEMVRQLRQARRGTAFDVDPISAAQLRTREHLHPAVLRARFHQAVPGAVAWRRRWSGPLGRVTFRVGAPIDEVWRVQHLMGTIYTRDTWMHRVDVCRATGVPMHLTGDHDGRIVADLVADWARRHGRPFRLTLTGPAGGGYVRTGDTPGEPLRLDAVEFGRVLSGRAPGAGPLATRVPF